MNGIDLIKKERERQIEEEGWTASHDDEHTEYELTQAAVSYALEAARTGLRAHIFPPHLWPWGTEWWKPLPPDGEIIYKPHSIRMLEKAGALIAAEIDRLLRRT